jgi:hypothetical protein
MFRELLFLAALVPLLLSPLRLLAGGPPFLCVPIDGVTQANEKAVTTAIDAKLENKRFAHPEWSDGVAIPQRGDQRYLTFYMKEDVSLNDIDEALKGTGCSIPRDRLKLFGHVILEIDPQTLPAKELVAVLDSMAHVSITDAKESNGLLQVTVEMPYPAVDNRPKPDVVGWEKFAANDYSSAQSSASEPTISAQALPSFNAFRNVVAKQNANLTGIQWSTTYACRALGCVTAPEAETALATATAPSSPQKN